MRNSGIAFRARAMRQLSTLVVVGIFVVPLAGCNSGNQESDASTSSTPPEVEPQPAAKPFTKPAVVNQPVKIAIASPGLIQPTNSNQRVKQVAKGRQDPFAGLFAQVNYTVPTGRVQQASGSGDSIDTSPQRTTQGLRRLSRDSGAQSVAAVGSRRSSSNRSGTSRPNIAHRSGSGSSRRPNNVVIAQGSGSSRPNSPGANSTSSNPPKPPTDTIATGTQTNPNQIPLPPVGAELPGALPPPPQQPDLAQKVAVSGVVQIGEQIQAIVRVPNEGASRYVGVGQRLSNGEVLVKRIEMNQGAEPIVILEQYGVEVAKAIGDTQSQETADTPDGSSAPESNPVPSPEDSPTPATPGGLVPTTPPTATPTPATPGGLVPTTPPTATPPPPPDGSDNIPPDSSGTSP